jgi:hypothetical protein
MTVGFWPRNAEPIRSLRQSSTHQILPDRRPEPGPTATCPRTASDTPGLSVRYRRIDGAY